MIGCMFCLRRLWFKQQQLIITNIRPRDVDIMTKNIVYSGKCHSDSWIRGHLTDSYHSFFLMWLEVGLLGGLTSTKRSEGIGTDSALWNG